MFSQKFSLFCVIGIFIACVSPAHSQVEVVNQQLITQYGLDFSDSTDPDRYSLELGSNELIQQGFTVTVGALYMLDHVSNHIELISKTLSGQPVVLEDLSVLPYSQVLGFDASADFNKVVYSSKNSTIVNGDEADSYDVFIYDRPTGQTTRIIGLQAHQGKIYDLRISPAGNAVAFESNDWNFGDTSGITGVNLGRHGIVYVYDIDSSLLTTPNIEKTQYSCCGGSGGATLSLFLAGRAVFSHDGKKLFFQVESEDASNVVFYSQAFWVHDLQANQTRPFLYGTPERPYGVAEQGLAYSDYLDDDHIVYNSGITNVETFEFIGMKVIVLNFQTGRAIEVPTGVWGVQQGQSSNKRYVTFYGQPDGPELLNELNLESHQIAVTSGTVWVLDLIGEELRQAFSVNRMAKSFNYNYNDIYGSGDIHDVCNSFFVVNNDFAQYSQQFLPCFSFYEIPFQENPSTTSQIDNYVQASVDAYDLSPSDIRFHNNDQFITFNANSWYLDETIALDDFTPQAIFKDIIGDERDSFLPAEYDNNIGQSYPRDTFVVANPFSQSINLLGQPVVDRSSESGVFIWRTFDGRTMVQVTAGDQVQNGQITDFEGSVVSTATIGSLTQIGIESSDRVSQTAMNRVEFDLLAQRPWDDRFSFIADDVKSLCINLDNYVGGLFLGPDKIKVTPPYDIHGLTQCNVPSIVVDGKPSINRTVDNGWYLWRENGQWLSELVAGDSSHVYQGGIRSTADLIGVLPISLESSDVFTYAGSELNFELLVTGPWYDGFQFNTDSAVSSCVYLNSPSSVSIYLGPNALRMPNSFDLNTLADCINTPDIVTRGKPEIDRSNDTGIFIWENTTNNWAAEVVSADASRVVELTVNSSQSITNTVPVNIESSDVFTVLANGIDMRLNVKAPWMDGFRFNDQTGADTCVSTGNADMSIFLGPNRVNVGNGISLDSQTNCP